MTTEPVESDDDLVRLWQASALPSPDPGRLARGIGRMTLARFDHDVLRRNVQETVGFVVLLGVCAWMWTAGGDRVSVVLAVGGGTVVMARLWWYQRQLPRIDPTADARTYQAALLARLDRQKILLVNTRYWYLLPLYLPILRTAAVTWPRAPWTAVVFAAASTALFVLIGWMSERVAVAALGDQRIRIATLYEDGGA